MNELGFFLGVIYIVAGLIMGVIAPLIGPNIFIGFRIGYTYSDREIWDKTNRLIGAIMVAIGIALILLSIYTGLNNDFYVLTTLLGGVLTFAFGFFYSKNLAEMKLSYIPPEGENVKPMKPFQLSELEKALFIASILLYFALITLIYLVGKPVPIKIDISGNVMNHIDPLLFAEIFYSVGLTLIAVTLIVLFVGKRQPVILHAGVLSKKWGRDVVFKIIVYVMLVQIISFNVLFIITYLYLTTGKSLFQTAYIISLLVLVSYSPFIWAIYRRLKYREKRRH